MSKSQAISANTVPAENQINANKFVTYEGSITSKNRILFLGNSITRHEPKIEIGWENDCGMSASCKDKDYVHRLMQKVYDIGSSASCCITQLAEWERNYWDNRILGDYYTEVPSYQPDIIIVRVVENVPADKLSVYSFADAYEKMVDFFNENNKAKIILTTSFWYAGERDDAIRSVANKCGYPLVELGHLGDMDEMKAIGLFEHDGVAAHPGDKGMEAIAEAIWPVLKGFIKR
jgi:hypothetical protein